MRKPAPARTLLFGWLYLILAVNGAASLAQVAISQKGWLAAAWELFGISAILWVAAAAGADLLLRAPDESDRIRPVDYWLCAAAGLCALHPVPPASSTALAVLSAWGAASATSSPMRRASFIFLSITTSLLWGRLLLALASRPLIAVDVWITSRFAGTSYHANMVDFAGGSGGFLVAPGCSSLHGISLALVLWTTLTQYYHIRLGRRAWLSLAGAVAGAILVNTARLALLARQPERFDFWHVGTGASAFGWLGLAVIACILFLGLRRDLVQG